jgi:hypothetical protein
MASFAGSSCVAMNTWQAGQKSPHTAASFLSTSPDIISSDRYDETILYSVVISALPFTMAHTGQTDSSASLRDF